MKAYLLNAAVMSLVFLIAHRAVAQAQVRRSAVAIRARLDRRIGGSR